MAITSKSTSSIKRKDLVNQRSPGVAFSTLFFAHEATAGDRVIDLTNLTPPAGAVVDDVSKLVGSRINDQRKSLKLYKGDGSRLLLGVSYEIVSNTKIVLTFDPLADEIIWGEIDPAPNTGLRVVGSRRILSTGILLSGETDINVGEFFNVGANIDDQMGDVSVYLEGTLRMRNEANVTATPSADGDYEEVDAGAGLGSLIRMNKSKTYDRAFVVRGNGLLIDNPSESTLEQLERLFGIVSRQADVLGAAAGVNPLDLLAGAPSNQLLKQFGDLVLGKQDAFTNLFQTKFLSSDITGSVTDSTVVTFNNLTVGRVYRIIMNSYAEITSSGTLSMLVHARNGTNAGDPLIVRWEHFGAASVQRSQFSAVGIFIASATSMRVFVTSGAADILRGNGTTTETHFILEELLNHEVTTQFT